MDDLISHLGHRIAVIGSGGKTSSIKAIANHPSHLSSTVFITTSTKMFKHELEDMSDLLIECTDMKHVLDSLTDDRDEDCPASSHNKQIIAFGHTVSNGHACPPKVSRSISYPDIIMSIPDRYTVLVEADGSRDLPLKAHSCTGERQDPVIPAGTTGVLAVVGASVVNSRWEEAVFRHAEAKELASEEAVLPSGDTDTSSAVVSICDVVNTVFHPSLGYFWNTPPTSRRAVLVNQTDTVSGEELEELVAMIKAADPTIHVYTASLRNSPGVMIAR
eukprot:gnl/Dysnectes_brevis/5617_a8178_424.p1 GENE.gnl/Dysnectes_brevis/5617_a8178_424~~gnl/Dysnectes_brevis/5617_a8178_424.p1  ORF type:complete len:275 (-),score=51.12 gnl/Dysnectes_brevis/5617_a8178_424:184-1008(-)